MLVLQKGFDGFVRGMNAVGSLWIVMIMVLLNADVIGRYVFNSPVSGVPLVISMSLIAIVSLQLPDALGSGRMTRNAALISLLLVKHPRLGRAFNALFCLIGAIFLAAVAWFTWPIFMKAWVSDSFLGSRGDFTLLEWPFKLLIVIGGVMTAIQYIRLTVINAGMALGYPPPDIQLPELEVPEVETLD
jgi:TRAP-type mannitol/chloroaromatic compound transport system permease small subunit